MGRPLEILPTVAEPLGSLVLLGALPINNLCLRCPACPFHDFTDPIYAQILDWKEKVFKNFLAMSY